MGGGLSQHPGFAIQPLSLCRPPGPIPPLMQASDFFSVSMASGLLDALLQLYTTIATDPLASGTAEVIWPSMVVVEQDLSASELVQHARSNGSVIINAPLLIMGPPFPTQLGQPIPATQVTLDLAGCSGCLVLPDSTVHVYLSDLHLTGLERPAAGNAGSGANYSAGGAAQLPLPSWVLWAFQFDRLSGNLSLHLRNVTLTLPQQDFLLLLDSLPMPAAEGLQQQLTAGQPPGLLDLKVGASPKPSSPVGQIPKAPKPLEP